MDKKKMIAEKVLAQIEAMLEDDEVKDYESRLPKFMEIKTNDPKAQEVLMEKLEELPKKDEEDKPEEEEDGVKKKLKKLL